MPNPAFARWQSPRLLLIRLPESEFVQLLKPDRARQIDGKLTPFHTCALLGAAATARTEAAVAFTMRRIAVRRRACLTGAKRLHGFASVNVSRACEPSLIESLSSNCVAS